MSDNPAHVYRAHAKQIVAKVKQNFVEMLEHGKSPDLYWKLEQAIVDAMRNADANGSERTRRHLVELMTEFDEDNGSSTS